MTQTDKQQIAAALKEYCEQKGSQNKAANSLHGVSSAIISKALSGDWELIAERMWRNIASQIGYAATAWQMVETRDFRDMMEFLTDAQDEALCIAVTGEAGCGKSAAVQAYAKENDNVHVLCCNEFWNRKNFMQELLRSMGRDSGGYTVGEMMGAIVGGLKTVANPLLVLDEADKLPDQVLYFFITLYNQLEGHCAIVMCATDHLEKRIRRGLRINKKGYKEIYSRIGRRFIALAGANEVDVTAVCIANGLTDKAEIKRVVNDCEGDLRRVKRKVFAIKKRLNGSN